MVASERAKIKRSRGDPDPSITWSHLHGRQGRGGSTRLRLNPQVARRSRRRGRAYPTLAGVDRPPKRGRQAAPLRHSSLIDGLGDEVVVWFDEEAARCLLRARHKSRLGPINSRLRDL